MLWQPPLPWDKPGSEALDTQLKLAGHCSHQIYFCAQHLPAETYDIIH